MDKIEMVGDLFEMICMIKDSVKCEIWFVLFGVIEFFNLDVMMCMV